MKLCVEPESRNAVSLMPLISTRTCIVLLERGWMPGMYGDHGVTGGHLLRCSLIVVKDFNGEEVLAFSFVSL
jgi:hypothetical protein